MTAMIFRLVGGIGLFLLGMALLTDGLKAFAGEALRRALVRFTGTPLKAFGSGALVTALIQSSSATTVAVIGFVSAGLLTFPQAVGVVFGASLGTTGTGWVVSVLGLKVSVGFYALPLVAAGAFLRLLARERGKSLGLALAGFGLIFVGIEGLQEGMRGLSGVFDLAKLPASGFGGHLLSLLIGVVMTVIMQSSSAAVATTMTALHAGAVNFEQAASLVIGAAIGTTVTGVLAAIGGSVPAKRTALAHVLFNLAAGLIAMLILPVFLWGIRLAQAHLGLEADATSLAAFHTLFIAVGVAVFLPMINPFSHWIERLLPERGSVLTRHLDTSLLQVPTVALEVTRRALREAASDVLSAVRASSGPQPGNGNALRSVQIQRALDQIQQFFAQIPPVTENAPLSQSRVTQMHAMDHLARLLTRLPPPASVRRMLEHDHLRSTVVHCQDLLDRGVAGLQGRGSADWQLSVERQALALAEKCREERPVVLGQTASGDWGPAQALEVLDALRWLDRVGYHAWRICHHLGSEGKEEPTQ